MQKKTCRFILQSTHNLGISNKFIRIIKALYLDTKARAWNIEMLSDAFHTEEGVKHGCNLSPLLWQLLLLSENGRVRTSIKIFSEANFQATWVGYHQII